MNTIKKFIKKIIPNNQLWEFGIIRKYPYYFSLKNKEQVNPIAIFSMDGKMFSNGFADRLRGMISIYAYAKCNNIEFRIDHHIPFKLEDYFVPNHYDWRLKKDEKNYNLYNSLPIVLLDYTKGKRLLYLNKRKQYHFFSNINCIEYLNKHYHKNYKYAELFAELFKPSPLLQKEIDLYINELGKNYISVSFRFMQLMGDFKDIKGETLNIENQTKLINKCRELLKSLHLKHSGISKILVTSDSTKFIESIKDIDFVYTIPGKIGHIGHTDDQSTYLKTMLDFCIISKAQKIYMAYTDKMYKSNFAKYASYITNAPFEAISF